MRDGAYLTTAQLMMHLRFARGDADSHPDKTKVARRLLVPGLFITLVIDAPASMAIVAERQLEEWGVDFETALDVALGNLRAKSQDPFDQVAPGLWLATWSDSFAAARLLLPEILQRVCTDPLVCVPNRDTLIVADPRRPKVFAHIVALILEAAKDERYPISRAIYQLEHKTLRPLAPPTAPPAVAALYARLRLDEQLRCYNGEKELRDQLEEEAFYASVMAHDLDDGSVISLAVWTEGVEPSYLPPAQSIQFVKMGDERKPSAAWAVPWSVVAATPGMLTMTDATLPRWQVGAFPSDSWLDEHGQRLTFDKK